MPGALSELAPRLATEGLGGDPVAQSSGRI